MNDAVRRAQERYGGRKKSTADKDAETINSRNKLCPFQSSQEKPVRCGSQCQLYKMGKDGYECPLQELSRISFALNPPTKY
jgi:hypothetical protein